MHLSIHSASITPNWDYLFLHPRFFGAPNLLSLSCLLLKCQILSLLDIPTYSGKYIFTQFCDNACCLQLPEHHLTVLLQVHPHQFFLLPTENFSAVNPPSCTLIRIISLFLLFQYTFHLSLSPSLQVPHGFLLDSWFTQTGILG